jgi:hypothetical protein
MLGPSEPSSPNSTVDCGKEGDCLKQPSFGAQKTFSFKSSSSKGLCQNTLRFDPEKYSEASLRDTIHLIFGPPDFQPLIISTGMKPADYLNFDFTKLNMDCANALDRANKVTLVPLEGIEDYLRSRVDEVKDSCDFYRIKIQGFSTPSTLRDYSPATACTPFIDALEGKTDMASVARETVLSVCRGNATCVQNWLALDTRVVLLENGWNNCAINYWKMNQATDRGAREQRRDQLEKQFRRLFNVRTGKCTPESQD